MRQIFVALLTASLVVAMPALAQDASGVSSPQCDPQILAGTVQAAQDQQQLSAQDAKAVNDYYKKIKEGVSSSDGKLLSCVDISWPDLPFSGMLPMVEQFIKNVGDKAVAAGCDKIRSQVRKADSLFGEDALKAKVLGAVDQAGNYVGGAIGGSVGDIAGQVVKQTGGGVVSSGGNTGVVPPASGGKFGGLIDLIKPRPTPPQK